MGTWPDQFKRMVHVDQLVKEHSLRGPRAAVLHRVAARCATPEGCKEGQSGMAQGLGLSLRAVNTAVKDLVDLGLLLKPKSTEGMTMQQRNGR